jgi:hypothetical protein
VLGISSSGYMAGRFHVAYSSKIRVTAIFPYRNFLLFQNRNITLLTDYVSCPFNLDLEFSKKRTKPVKNKPY